MGEIHQQANPVTRGAKVVDALGVMTFAQCCDGLYLDDNRVLD
jgi:hypothetical protein